MQIQERERERDRETERERERNTCELNSLHVPFQVLVIYAFHPGTYWGTLASFWLTPCPGRNVGVGAGTDSHRRIPVTEISASSSKPCCTHFSFISFCLSNHCSENSFIPVWLHYENKPIQMYWKFYHQKKRKFSDEKLSNFSHFCSTRRF